MTNFRSAFAFPYVHIFVCNTWKKLRWFAWA